MGAALRKCCATVPENVRSRSNVFDLPLTRLWEMHDGIPPWLEECLVFFESRPAVIDTRLFMQEEDDARSEELANIYERGGEARLADNTYEASTVGYFFVKWLSRVPEGVTGMSTGVFLRKAVDDVKSVDSSATQGDFFDTLQCVARAVMNMPSPYLEALRRVAHVLTTIAIAQEDIENGIDGFKLCQIFGPLLLPKAERESAAPTNEEKLKHELIAHKSQDVVKFLIDNFYDIYNRNPFRDLNGAFQRNKDLEGVNTDNEARIAALYLRTEQVQLNFARLHHSKCVMQQVFLCWKYEIRQGQNKHQLYRRLDEMKKVLQAERLKAHRLERKLAKTRQQLELRKFDERIKQTISQARVSQKAEDWSQLPFGQPERAGSPRKSIRASDTTDELTSGWRHKERDIVNLRKHDKYLVAHSNQEVIARMAQESPSRRQA